MKRNNLTTAVVAGLAGVAGFAGLANAVDLNPDGLGQVLIYPYYTVNNGFDSQFSVVNTDTVNGKAVKVRFLEGYNSREVLDFNLFLSPADVWTAKVVQTSDDAGGVMSTTDHSCTNPVDINAVGTFRNYAYIAGGVFGADGGPTDLTRTREGYLEMIQMGDIPPGNPLYDSIVHVQDGTPNGGVPACDLVGDAAGAYLTTPTGGLFGSGGIINVEDGIFFNYNADAIDGFSSRVIFSGTGSLDPSLQQANSLNSTTGGAVAYIFNNGQLLTLDYADPIDAVSAVYTASTIFNEYYTATGLGAATDWVLTFPTKRFYVDPYFVGDTPIQPFPTLFEGDGSGDPGSSGAPLTIALNIYDQEEGTTSSPIDVSPPPPNAPNALSYEVNVISFLQTSDANAGVASGVFGSALVANVVPFADAGWLSVNLAVGDGGHVMRPAANGDTLAGLPGTGFEAIRVINANAEPGKLANYGGLFRHRSQRSCTNAGGACS